MKNILIVLLTFFSIQLVQPQTPQLNKTTVSNSAVLDSLLSMTVSTYNDSTSLLNHLGADPEEWNTKMLPFLTPKTHIDYLGATQASISTTDVLGVVTSSIKALANNTSKPATYTIAANDSQNKSLADYICNGVNDEIEIQAAIDALPAEGGSIEFLAGNYQIDATVFTDPLKKLELRGRGKASVLNINATVGINIKNSNWSGNNQEEDFLITGFRVESANVFETRGIYVDSSHISRIHGNTFRGDSLVAIFYSSGNNCSVTNNDFNECMRGIEYERLVEDFEDIKITNNDFSYSAKEHIKLVGQIGGSDVYVNKVIISNNNMEEADVLEQGYSGVHIEFARHVLLSGNTITQTEKGSGVYFKSGSYNTISHNIIAENGITAPNTVTAIILEDEDYTRVEGNTIGINSLNGIEIISGIENKILENTFRNLTGTELIDGGTDTYVQDKFNFKKGSNMGFGTLDPLEPLHFVGARMRMAREDVAASQEILWDLQPTYIRMDMYDRSGAAGITWATQLTGGDVAIGTTTSTAKLDVRSTNSGIRFPNVANTAAVVTPDTGETIFDLSDGKLKTWDGTTWQLHY